jgi:crotonobetainyl-CoA:carnitine CoA-transferase CaiB-like acyl-CoA transferase
MMKGLGLGYPDLEKINPRLVMTSITPFGQTGPYKDYKVSDMVLWSMGGVQYSTGEPDLPPIQMSLPQSYFHGGIHAAMGSMMAHYYRQKTGIGQHVDVSIQQAVMLTLMIAAEAWELYGQTLKELGVQIPPRGGAYRIIPRTSGPLKTRMIWPCIDGYIIWSLAVAGGSSGNIASSRALTQLMRKKDMAGRLKDFDWTQLDTLTITQEEVDEIENIMGKFFMSVTKAEIFKQAVDAGIYIAPVFTAQDIHAYSHLKDRKFWADVEHPELRDVITYPGAFVDIDKAPWKVYRRPPLIGEHNMEIYGEELGISSKQQVILKQANVI